MDAVIGIGCLVLLVLAFMPTVRNVAAGIESIENPTKRDTAEEQQQARDGALWSLMLVVVAFGLLFAMQAGVL